MGIILDTIRKLHKQDCGPFGPSGHPGISGAPGVSGTTEVYKKKLLLCIKDYGFFIKGQYYEAFITNHDNVFHIKSIDKKISIYLLNSEFNYHFLSDKELRDKKINDIIS